MRSRASLIALATVLTLSGVSERAMAQGGLGKKDKTQAQPPEQPPAQPAAPTGDPLPGPYIVRDHPRDVILRMHLHVNSDNPTQKSYFRDPFTGKTAELPKITPFEFTTLSVLWPAIPGSASSDQAPNTLTGKLLLNDQVVSTQPTLLEGYPGGVQFARFDTGDSQEKRECRQVDLFVENPMRIYRTTFDEVAAFKVPWPTGPWPKDVQSLMAPQLFLETGLDVTGAARAYDDKLVTEALDRFLKRAKISEPKGVTPVALAKVLTAAVWETIQISGQGQASKDRTGEFAGLTLNPPAEALKAGRANEHEAAALLATIFRKAGLPARVVIGWEAGTGEARFLSKSSTRNRIRTWVEFCLFDEAKNTVNWVPVDVSRLRRTGSRAQALDRPWNYFGSHDELDGVLPFAFQFFPPTDVSSYGYPAFWGWFATPKPPSQAEQALTFDAAASSAGPEDPRSKKDTKGKPEVKRGQ